MSAPGCACCWCWALFAIIDIFAPWAAKTSQGGLYYHNSTPPSPVSENFPPFWKYREVYYFLKQISPILAEAGNTFSINVNLTYFGINVPRSMVRFLQEQETLMKQVLICVSQTDNLMFSKFRPISKMPNKLFIFDFNQMYYASS